MSAREISINVPEKSAESKTTRRKNLSRLLSSHAEKGRSGELKKLLEEEEEAVSVINDQGGLMGMTPLHEAIYYNKLEVVKVLVEKGADLEVVFEYGTPLAVAAIRGYGKIARYLMRQGASRSNAINSAADDLKALVQTFFMDLQRVSGLRSELEEHRRDLEAKMRSATSMEKLETLPTTTKGITIAGLRKIDGVLRSECQAGRFSEDKSFPDGTLCKGTTVYEELTTGDIVYRYVKDKGVTGNKRLADCQGPLDPLKDIPRYFISHAWKGQWTKLLELIWAGKGLSDNTCVWIDAFAVNQHGWSELCSDFSKEQNAADVASFQDVIQTCLDGTIVICDYDKVKVHSRAWCLYEWGWTMFFHGQQALHMTGLAKKDAYAGANDISVEKADCFRAEDKAMIIRAIMERHGSPDVFDQKLKNKLWDAYNNTQRLSADGENSFKGVADDDWLTSPQADARPTSHPWD